MPAPCQPGIKTAETATVDVPSSLDLERRWALSSASPKATERGLWPGDEQWETPSDTAPAVSPNCLPSQFCSPSPFPFPFFLYFSSSSRSPLGLRRDGESEEQGAHSWAVLRRAARPTEGKMRHGQSEMHIVTEQRVFLQEFTKEKGSLSQDFSQSRSYPMPISRVGRFGRCSPLLFTTEPCLAGTSRETVSHGKQCGES